MKTLIVSIVAASAVALGLNAHAQTPTSRIVVVDLNKLFNDYYKTPIASAKLKDTAENYQKEREDMLAQFRKLTDELNKLREDQDKPEYSAEVKEQKKKLVQEKLSDVSKNQREIEEYTRTHQVDLDRQTQRMRQTILKEITEVVSKESRDSGYMLVLDKSGNTLNGVASVVFSQDALDITDGILKILNKNAPKATETPAKAPEKKSDEKK